MINTSHRIRIYPNRKQQTLLAKSCGVARFAYNYALASWNEQYKAGGKPNEASIRKQLNAVKKTEYLWMYEVSKCCPQLAIKNLGKAFDKFFRGKARHPKFHSKHGRHSFQLDNISFRFRGSKLHLAKIGEVRLAETFRFPDAKLLSATVSKEADKWFVAISCETVETDRLPDNSKVIGIDVGVREYVDSDGKRHLVPRVYRLREKRLRRLQQSLSRKQKGSCNREKARIRVARQHAKVRNIRQDWLHKLTTRLVRENSVIGIEDLNVRGMLKNKRLAKSISDACFGEFRRQIEYKSQRYGRLVVLIPRFYPSSKLCNRCGAKTKHLTLSVRSWTCETCGTQHDRDVNAAVNIKNFAASSAVPACGEFFANGDTACGGVTKRPRRSRKLTENLET